MTTNWLMVLKGYVDTLETIIGSEGGTSLANKLTAARAALLEQITAARLAELDAANLPADVDTLKTYCDILDDAVNGLAAIKAEVEGLAGAVMRGTDNAALAASWTAALATALGNYTAARAGYLDNINQAGLLQVTAARAALLDQITALRLAELDAANIPADIDGLKTSRNRQLFQMDFWQRGGTSTVINQAAATVAWGDIEIEDIPTGATVVRAIAMIKFRTIENTNAIANNLDGSTVAGASQVLQVQKAAGTWRDAIRFNGGQLRVPASTLLGGDVIFGEVDISIEVVGNGTYSGRWLLAKAAYDSLEFRDDPMGIRLWYSV